jgi:hypothetical protein
MATAGLLTGFFDLESLGGLLLREHQIMLRKE